MLSELHISNFALIEDQTVSFGPGLNVISGETGSGKSILLQAIQFLLGAKFKNQIIRSGADEAQVEGVFNLESISRQIFEELPDLARTDELSIGRSLSNSGKAKVYINGRLASLSVLEDIAEKLVNICGQNQHVRLLDARYHLELVDGYAMADTNGAAKQLSEYKKVYEEWREKRAHLEELTRRSSFATGRRAELEVVVSELDAAKIRTGLRSELEGRVKKLAGAERLISAGQGILDAIGAEAGLNMQLQSIAAQTQEILKLDAGFSEVAKLFASARMELKEFESEVARYVSRIEVDEKALDDLRDQLAEVARLERKYRRDEAGLIQLLAESRKELNSLEEGLQLEKLEAEVAKLYEQLEKSARGLTELRKKAGQSLSQAVAEELAELNMNGCQLELDLHDVEFGPNGKDRAELLISTNKGEPVKALKSIASGGELSRIMLVLKQVLRDRTGVNVLVFDEVDSGVSGGVARAVGKKLKTLAQYSQVICITHLPQVASLADHHFLVGKEVTDRAVTVVQEIKGDKRLEEVARMLAGSKITQASRQSARELMSSTD